MFTVVADMLWVYIVLSKHDKMTEFCQACLLLCLELHNNQETYAVD